MMTSLFIRRNCSVTKTVSDKLKLNLFTQDTCLLIIHKVSLNQNATALSLYKLEIKQSIYSIT